MSKPAAPPAPARPTLVGRALMTIVLFAATVVATAAAQLASPEPAIAVVIDPGLHTIAPVRILDQRPAIGGVTGPGRSLDLRVTGRDGVPSSGVTAVALNVTVSQPTGSGYITVWPAGQPRPGTSNVNFAVGRTVTNLVIVKVGTDGQVTLFNSSGYSTLIVDVVGWFATAGGLNALTPARLMDTRGSATVDNGGPRGALRQNGQVNLTVAGRGGVPATGAGSVVLNVVVTQPTTAGYVTVWPTGQTRPHASNLNVVARQTVPNLVIAKVGSGGNVSFFNTAGSAHLVVDVLAWLPNSASYTAITPTRLMDTRGNATIDNGGPRGIVGANRAVALQVGGRGGVPRTGVGAVVINLTVTQPGANGQLTAWATGDPQPATTNLSYTRSQTVPNLVITKVSAAGSVTIHTTGATHLVADVLGWFPLERVNNTAVLAAGVVRPPASTVASVVSNDPTLGTASVMMSTLSGLAVGSVALFAPSANLPTGYLGRVASIVSEGGQQRVNMTAASVFDAVPNASVYVDFAAATTTLSANGTVLGSISNDSSTTQGPAPRQANGRERLAATCQGSAQGSLAAEFDVSIGGIQLDRQWDGFSGNTFAQAVISPVFTAKFSGSLAANATCSIRAAAATIPLKPIRVCIPVPGFCIPFQWSHHIDISLDGNLTSNAAKSFAFTTTASAVVGARVGRGAKLIGEFRTDQAFEPSAELSLSGSLNLAATYNGAAVGMIGFRAGFGPRLDFKADAVREPNLTVDLSLEGPVSFWAEAVSQRLESPTYTLKTTPWRLLTRYDITHMNEIFNLNYTSGTDAQAVAAGTAVLGSKYARTTQETFIYGDHYQWTELVWPDAKFAIGSPGFGKLRFELTPRSFSDSRTLWRFSKGVGIGSTKAQILAQYSPVPGIDGWQNATRPARLLVIQERGRFFCITFDTNSVARSILFGTDTATRNCGYGN